MFSRSILKVNRNLLYNNVKKSNHLFILYILIDFHKTRFLNKEVEIFVNDKPIKVIYLSYKLGRLKLYNFSSMS